MLPLEAIVDDLALLVQEPNGNRSLPIVVEVALAEEEVVVVVVVDVGITTIVEGIEIAATN